MAPTVEGPVPSFSTSRPFELDWVKAENQEAAGPDSFVIFVVSKLALSNSGQHYPLAVVKREGGLLPMDAIQGESVLAAIEGTIAVFSDPANRASVESELSLAAQFYRDSKNALPTIELSNQAQWQRQSLGPEWDCSMREFPFISTSLILGAAFDRKRAVGLPARPAPLGTVFRDTNTEYALAVVDISDLKAIRYGIVAFRSTLMIHVSGAPDDSDDDWGDGDPDGERKLRLEENRTREPLSATAYINEFEYEPCDSLIAKLNGVGLVDTAALDRIWPRSGSQALPLPVPPGTKEEILIPSLVSRAIGTTSHDIPGTLLGQISSTANYKTVLREELQKQSQNIGHLRSTGQLLGLAFANEPHLNLASFTNLSALSIGAALETTPAPPTSISLTIDTLSASQDTIIDILAAHPTLTGIYLLQQPTRTSDDPSTAFFFALASHPSNPLSRLTKLHISGAYSAPLRKAFVSLTLSQEETAPNPTPTAAPATHPVLHLFTQNHQPRQPPTNYHYYLGDTLQRPDRLASGFLQYLRSLLTSSYYDGGARPQALFGFACAPPGLSDLTTTAPTTTTDTTTTTERDYHDRVEIAPLPAESFALPSRSESGGRRPVVRDLPQGSWVVLARRRVWVDEGNKREGGRGAPAWLPDWDAAWVEYAFVKVVRDGGVSVVKDRDGDGGGGVMHRAAVGEGDVEVGGLEEFLEATVPGVDLEVVRRRVGEFVTEMEEWPGQAVLPEGVRKLGVLGEREARELLVEFLEDVKRWG